jgi:hypothetical protein
MEFLMLLGYHLSRMVVSYIMAKTLCHHHFAKVKDDDIKYFTAWSWFEVLTFVFAPVFVGIINTFNFLFSNSNTGLVINGLRLPSFSIKKTVVKLFNSLEYDTGNTTFKGSINGSFV